jgi:ATP-dependent protease ClpP protease subunit
MPGRNEIYDIILHAKANAQDEIRRGYLKNLSDYTERDTIIYASAFSTAKYQKLPGIAVSITNEDIQGFMSAFYGLKNKKLDLILHSPGGSLEAAEQIVNYLRAKYEDIRAIVPQNAMSAATMIACACDSIIMGKHSAIGPIDPQIIIQTSDINLQAPAQSIINEFNQAKKEIIENPAVAPIWINKIKNLPYGILDICDRTIKLSKERVCNWLESFMFKDDQKATEKAEEISTWLGDANFHKSHGKPISINDAKDIGLKVIELEADQELQEKVLSVYHASVITLEITECVKFIENHEGKGRYTTLQIPKK